MEISVSEGDDQQADNSENNNIPSACDKKDSSVINDKIANVQIEKSTKLKDKSENENSSPSKHTGSSKSSENDPSRGPVQEFKLEVDKQVKMNSNQALAKSDFNLVKVKTDVKKVKIKTDANQAKGKVDSSPTKGKVDKNQDKTITEPNKNKSKEGSRQIQLESGSSEVNITEDIQPKAKTTDQSPSKLRQDQNQIKVKLNHTKPAGKLNQFQAKAVAYDAENKSKVEIIPKDSAKPKKKFYFLFRVKEFNIIAVKKDDQKYKCHVCNGIYRQKFSLKRHFLRNHINPEYISFSDISNCKINVPNEKNLQQVAEETKLPSGRKRFKTKDAIFLEGNKSRMMPGLYKCHECNEIKLDLESELKAHYVSHPNAQPDENFPCDQCSAVFQKRAVLNKHMMAHHEKRTSFNCKKCKQEFPNDLEFQKHVSNQGNGGKCKYCEKEFCTAVLRKKHEHLHEGMKGYSCKHCREIFAKIDDVKKHVVKFHASLYLTCSYCPKQAFPNMFATKSLLSAHVLEKHDGILGKKSSAVCSTGSNKKNCNGKFATVAESVCSYCQKKFPGVHAMLRHKTIAHKKLLNKHKNAAHKKNVLAKKQSTMAAKQKAYNKKIANEKKMQQKNMVNKNKVLHKERTTYERKAKQAVQDKSVIERFSARRIRFESSRIAMNRFYANLPQNIAENLLEHVDGRAHQLSLKKYNFNDNNEFLDNRSHHDRDQIPWSSYNFPNDFDVQLALNKRGREVKPKVPDEEECLYATGLGKVNNDVDNHTENSNNDILSTQANKDVIEFRDKVYDDAELRTLSLEDKKKLLCYDPVVVFICCICKQKYNSFQEMDDHIHNNHPNVEPSWIEVEGSKDAPPIVPLDLCREPCANPDGVLFSCVVPPLMPDICTLKCTKCYRLFHKSCELHQHLLECGGNEGLQPKFRKKLNLQKRIKHTMKHRMDLSVKQVASKKESPYKDFKNGRIEKAKVKYGKDYFSTKTGKNVRAQSPLPFQQKNITCFFCKEKFDSKLLLTEHYSICSKFNRKKKRKTASPIAKKTLNNSNQTPGEKNKTLELRKIVPSISETISNLQASSENGLDLTVTSLTKVPVANSASHSGAQNSITNLPSANVFSNKIAKLSNTAINDLSVMDLSKKPVKQLVMSKLMVPTNVENRKVTCNLNAKEKTPIEALHETVQRIEANGTRKDHSTLIIGKISLPRSRKLTAPPEIVVNRGIVSPKPIAPKPILPNPKQNLPKIKEVVNEIKLAASNSPNLKKTPLMFIVSNSDVNKGAVRNINSAISTIKTKLNDQVSNEPSNKVKEQSFVARRKRKKEQPTKVVQKTADITNDTTKFVSQQDNLLLSENIDEKKNDVLQPLVTTTDSAVNCIVAEEINKTDNVVKTLSSETKLMPIDIMKDSAVTKESSTKSTLINTSVTCTSSVIPSTAAQNVIPDFTSTESKQDQITTHLFLPNEKADGQCNNSEDRDSPTLELLVSSVTQNIENFDKPSFLDDEKFALPTLNINSTVTPGKDKATESTKNSLNFRIIIPDVESQPSQLLESNGPLVLEVNSQHTAEESTNLYPSESTIPEFDSQKSAENLTSISSPVGLSHLSVAEESGNLTKVYPPKSKQSDSPGPDSVPQRKNILDKLITSHSISSKPQNSILDDKDVPSSKAEEQNNQFQVTVSSEVVNNNSTLSSAVENNSSTTNVPIKSKENVELSSITTSEVPKPLSKQTSPLNKEQVNVVDSALCNSEISSNPSIDNTTSKQVEVSVVKPFDSLEETFAAVLKGGSSRRGRRPTKRSLKRPRGLKRSIDSKASNSSDKLNISLNSVSSHTKPTKSKNSKAKPSLSATSQLRAFRIESTELSNKSMNETLSGKSDHSNSSEVASDFGKDLASRMKERMRLSFGTVPPESGKELGSEASKNSQDENQRDPSTAVASSDLPEMNLNGTYLNEHESERDVDDCLETVSSIKKEYKESELSKKHICPFCILEFAYLTNFRRHLKICKSKYDNLTIETPTSTTATSQIQHLPKKDEVEESMLNLLRHQSRQNQMIKETQPVKASEPEKNFQKFNCESCHKIYFSLFKLMQHRMKEHLMPSAETKTMNLDQSAPEFDEDSQCSLDSSIKDTAELDNLSNYPVKSLPFQAHSTDAQDNSAIGYADMLKEDKTNCPGKESCFAEGDENHLFEKVEISSSMADTSIGAIPDELNVEPTPEVKASSSSKEPPNDSSNKSTVTGKKYKELIDPNYFSIPSFGKGRGRKKKSLVENEEEKSLDVVARSDTSDKIEESVNKETKNIAQKSEEKLQEKKSVTNSPKGSTSSEPQSKRDIYLKILENCSKVSIVRNTAAKDSNKLKVNSRKDKLINNTLEHANMIQSISNLSSPVKKRGRPRLSTTNSVTEKKLTPKSAVMDMDGDIDVYTVSSEKNSKEITVVKERNSQNLSFLGSSSPAKPGRKRAAGPVQTVNPPKLKRGKYIRVKKDIPTFSPDSSEFETDDSASFIVSGDDVIPSPFQLSAVTKLPTSKSRIGAKPLNIPRAKELKGKRSAIQKFLPGLSMNKITKVSKSPKTVSLSTAGPAAESSPISNSANSKSKAVGKFMNIACDKIPGTAFTVVKGIPKNSRAVKLDSSPDDASDFRPLSFGKRVNNTICPICKKKFPATLLRNRHLRMAHGRRNNRIDVELPSAMQEEQKLNKQLNAAEVRPKFQRHCIKPLPPLKRKYQKTVTGIAHLKKQKL